MPLSAEYCLVLLALRAFRGGGFRFQMCCSVRAGILEKERCRSYARVHPRKSNIFAHKCRTRPGKGLPCLGQLSTTYYGWFFISFLSFCRVPALACFFHQGPPAAPAIHGGVFSCRQDVRGQDFILSQRCVSSLAHCHQVVELHP